MQDGRILTLREHLVKVYEEGHDKLAHLYSITGDLNVRRSTLAMTQSIIDVESSIDPIMDQPYIRTPGIRVDINS